jgi:hypothetical protein
MAFIQGVSMNLGQKSRVTLMCVALSLGASLTPAAAHTTGIGQSVEYYARGWDGNDRPAYLPDVRSSLRKVFRGPEHRWLVVRVTAYEPWSMWFRVRVGLDSRLGPKPDFMMNIYNADMDGGAGCWVKRQGAGSHAGHIKGSFSQHEEVITCRIRASRVPADKHIRWFVRAASLNDVSRYDRAPDHGWYP